MHTIKNGIELISKHQLFEIVSFKKKLIFFNIVINNMNMYVNFQNGYIFINM